MTPEQLPSGERRSPVEKYYARVDWGSARDVAKVLRAYGRILLDAPRDESREKLLRALRVDGIGPWVTTTVRTRSRLAIRMPSSTSGEASPARASQSRSRLSAAPRTTTTGESGAGTVRGVSVWASRTGWQARNASGWVRPGPKTAPALATRPRPVDDERLGDADLGIVEGDDQGLEGVAGRVGGSAREHHHVAAGSGRAEVGRDRGAATAEAPPFLRPLLRTQELAEGVD